jgi:type 1 glutamine amidotransferase
VLALAGLLAAALVVKAAAADTEADRYWAQWRGPYSTGVSRSATPPTEWSETKNIKWKTEIPGRGSGSPVVWGDRVFVLTAIPTNVTGAATHAPLGGAPRVPHKFVVLALDRKTGNIAWERVAKEEAPHEASHPQNGTWASSSAITDGQHVIAYFESRGVFVYDMNGAQADLGRSRQVPVNPPNPALWPRGTKIQVDPPSDNLKKGFPALLQQGKGIVFFHHALASWIHSWPEYVEVMGGACDWGNPINIRGVQHPQSGFFGMTPQHITVVDKSHPITQGLGDGFDIVDESYSCPIFEDSVHPLLRTDFVPADHNRNLAASWKYSNLAGWVKTAENSPVAYIQMGHGPAAWANPQYRKLMLNAIKWAASPEAMAWAKANPTRIFKASTN